ncbi:hypothetical protein B0H16DRAFT_1824584 [Mycena metata]|uniref:Novel STAND NTPase 1 domain-containing protein n=1 Tax=Mycena metata TaxID=1033252 RepID=A0AAD7GWY3_9AGAR|nr:hypothetical protein B0H16DRAFT_1824584 [Mycena metata]
MPHQTTTTQARLNNILNCVAITANTFDILVNILKISGLEAISNTIQSLLRWAQTIKQDKRECAELMEQTHELLNAIITTYIKSDTGAELPPSTLNQIVKFTETLHKIHTFVEAQQSGSKVKKFFRQAELTALLKDCKAGLQRALDFFNIKTVDIMTDVREMQDKTQLRHQEILNMIETLSSSDSASFTSDVYSGSYASSNSISMLPAEPKIFCGRDSELADILKLFRQGTPRIAILGAGGMGKTSLARIVVHNQEIITKYQANRFFVTCDTASSKPELAGLVGAHLGMKPGEDLTQMVLQHFSSSPPTLLILDNLETVWEPAKSRKDIEEFLSLLTDINSLALMVGEIPFSLSISLIEHQVTMRGAERPSKVQWTQPFLQPLPPLALNAARKMFIDIADDKHPLEEVDQILGLTDNMPLAISLLAHLVDMEGCKETLSCWEVEKTSLISDGSDRRSNLELINFSFTLSTTVGTRLGTGPINRITSNYTNIKNILENGLRRDHPSIVDVAYCACDFNDFSAGASMILTLKAAYDKSPSFPAVERGVSPGQISFADVENEGAEFLMVRHGLIGRKPTWWFKVKTAQRKYSEEWNTFLGSSNIPILWNFHTGRIRGAV